MRRLGDRASVELLPNGLVRASDVAGILGGATIRPMLPMLRLLLRLEYLSCHGRHDNQTPGARFPGGATIVGASPIPCLSFRLEFPVKASQFRRDAQI
jgi:hypothetical protein